jgi:hypothetical protein
VRRSIWLSRRSIGLHVLIVVIVPTFIALCVWQVHRALEGNELSWAYVFEWPFFAGYAIYMWWRFVHEAPLEPSPESPPVSAELVDQDVDDDDAAERAAYNTYLAELAARDQRKQWR